MSDMKQTFKFSDSVLARIVQIVQEGMMLGIDVTDLMRQIELTTDEADESVLVPTKSYLATVERMHQDYIERAQQLKEEQN